MNASGPRRILIVAGAFEAFALARALPQAQVALCEPERVPRHWDRPLHHGPISADWLARAGIGAVIEAAHPCHAGLAHHVARQAVRAGVPHLQLVRPAWRAGRRDRWVHLRDPGQVAGFVPGAARVFTAIGRGDLAGLRAFRGEVLARIIGPAPARFPLRRGRFLPARGPFSPGDEIALLRGQRIDWLVVRNAGGTGGWPKLAAARALNLPVAMLARPPRPPGPRVQTVEEALEWLKRIEKSNG